MGGSVAASVRHGVKGINPPGYPPQGSSAKGFKPCAEPDSIRALQQPGFVKTSKHLRGVQWGRVFPLKAPRPGWQRAAWTCPLDPSRNTVTEWHGRAGLGPENVKSLLVEKKKEGTQRVPWYFMRMAFGGLEGTKGPSGEHTTDSHKSSQDKPLVWH